nr:unnamed protein product [Callosobruchus analis]
MVIIFSQKSYRGRKPTVAPLGGGGNAIVPPENGSGTSSLVPQPQSVRPSPQPLPVQQPMPVQQQSMGPMPFYADPNRFATPVWQADPSQGWTQSQFIQQIPAAAAQPIEAYQQYPNGIYQATYQQPAFEANTFYTTGPVQVLTNPRPPSTPNSQVQQLGPPRPNSNYSHTPSPSPAQQQQQQNNNGRQYQDYNISQQQIAQQQNEASQTNSRPGSVNNGNPPTPNSNYQQQPQTPNSNYQQQQPQTPVSQQQSPQQQSQMSSSAFTTIASFSPNSSASYASAGSGNAQPGYPQVNSNSPRLASHSSSGYSGQEQFGGQENNDWRNDGQIMWDEPKTEQQNQQYDSQQDSNKSELKNGEQPEGRTFSQADKVNLNTRIKTMILNKQQENKDEPKQVEQNTAGHFLWYSHHHHLTDRLSDDGGTLNPKLPGLVKMPSIDRNIRSPNMITNQHRRNFVHHTDLVKEECPTNPGFIPQMHHTDFNPGYYGANTVKSKEQTDGQHTPEIKTHSPTSNNYAVNDRSSLTDKSTLPFDVQSFSGDTAGRWAKQFPHPTPESPIQNTFQTSMLTEKLSKKQMGMEIPNCSCFPPNQVPPEPGTYYTHLGCANDLKSLRYDLECRTGVIGKAIRIEKIKYTGKEGKTAQGCPIAKWVIRRQNLDEKYLVLVKQRKGHVCYSAFIVVCVVVWDGVERSNADDLYNMLTEKLNKYGVPTKRRCATNEPRTCACQGIDENTSGASFSFGCSWSMYYNGCKFTRSKEVRKFRLTEKSEEAVVEDKLQKLADLISPLYKSLAPKSFQNQIHFEEIAPQCRLGLKSGRPFSGVTACVDFCAHSHKDLHNMTNGCTVVVSLTKHRELSKALDEQLHVLPLYVADDTDEFGSKENQDLKVKNGGIEVLQKYPCEVRTCSVPAETCLRRNKKGQEPGKPGRKRKTPTAQACSPSKSSANETPSVDEIQNGQVSSTVPGYPNPQWGYDNLLNLNNSNTYYYKNDMGNCDGYQPASNLPRFSFFKTPFSTMNTLNYPAPNSFLKNEYYYNDWNANYYHPPNLATPHMNQYASQFSNCPSYHTGNPFDDVYNSNSFLKPPPTPPLPVPPTPPSLQHPDTKQKVVNVTYTDNLECFQDNQIGGVAIALQHGSILFECAKHELHATTALRNPNRLSPTRISLVFYQHRNLNKAYHGLNEYTEKAKHKSEVGDSPDKLPNDYKYDVSNLANNYDVLMRTSTLPTVSLTTRFPMFPCMITGPFQEQRS